MSSDHRQYQSPYYANALPFAQMPSQYGPEPVLQAGNPSSRSQQAQYNLESLRMTQYRSHQTQLNNKAPQLVMPSPHQLNRPPSEYQTQPVFTHSSHASSPQASQNSGENKPIPSPAYSTPTQYGGQQLGKFISYSSPLSGNLAARVRPMMEIQDASFEVLQEHLNDLGFFRIGFATCNSSAMPHVDVSDFYS
jgi:hypothetical protein